jgi:hypothetical protein
MEHVAGPLLPDRMRIYPASDPDRFEAYDRATAQDVLESGGIVYLPRLGFELSYLDKRFLSERWSDGRAKNISLRPGGLVLKGAKGPAADLADLASLLERFAIHAEKLVRNLLPGYAGSIGRAGTSLRTFEAGRRDASWHKDDTRLHVDSFNSVPTRGFRLLRVFCNVNPAGVPRVWRVGESFPQFARRFRNRLRTPRRGLAQLLHRLRLARHPRSVYDHLMLQLHDAAKESTAYQGGAPQRAVSFRAGATWLVFSDQVLHAAMSGQFAFEQTFLVDPRALASPEASPLRVLEKLTGRTLGDADGHALQ